MTDATRAARTAAQLREAAQDVARVAARRSGQTDAQMAVPSVSQRLELAITEAHSFTTRYAQRPRNGDSGDWPEMLRQSCAEIVDAARDYLRATRPAERELADGSPSSVFPDPGAYAGVGTRPGGTR